MIQIGKLFVEIKGEEAFLKANIKEDDKEELLWYKVKKENANYLCVEKSDAFLVALLIYAMRKNQDIHLKTPVSEKLYYKIVNFLIPALSKTNKGLYNIKIECETDNTLLETDGLNGMGMSCGIDSFFTLCKSNKQLTNMQVNCLTFFNMGSHGEFGGESARELFNERKKESEKFAQKHNFKFVEVDSNISEFINLNFVQTHTYRNCSAVLALQKLFSNYYYSSGISIYEFKIDPEDSTAYYDIFLLNIISTENVTFFSTGTTETRCEKVLEVSKYKPSYESLNVCAKESHNCSKCEKCIRTMITLDMYDKLDSYNDVFDVEDYKKNRKKYIAFMIHEKNYKNQKYVEIYREYVKRRKIDINIFSIMLTYIPQKHDIVQLRQIYIKQIAKQKTL